MEDPLGPFFTTATPAPAPLDTRSPPASNPLSSAPSPTHVAQPSSYAPSPASSNVVPKLSPDANFSSKLLHFHHCMNMDRIPRTVIHDFVFEHGCPDQRGMRSLLWKLLLNYMPWNQKDWESSLRQSRASYEKFQEELITNPYKKLASESDGIGPNGRVLVNDDPLSGASTDWSEYYKDEEIRKEIDKDVKRTYSSFHFFQERVNPVVMTLEEAREKAKQEAKDKDTEKSLFDQPAASSKAKPANGGSDDDEMDSHKRFGTVAREDEKHSDVIRRILFIYAKLNPGVRYVQGMNEILAPMYYVFAHDTSALFHQYAEHDAFFCFTNVMSDIRDRFIKSLDNSPSGVLAVVKQINEYLKQLDPELWLHLEAQKVDPRFYSFRWITLLLSQEFELPEVLRLWDSLFADVNRFEFLLYCCCSMLVCVRQRLLDGEFADALRILQHYPESGIEFLTIISTATKLKKNLEARKRGETPSEPVVPESSYQQYYSVANANRNVSNPASPSNNGQQQSQSQASPVSVSLSQAQATVAAAGVAAQAQAQRVFKSVSSFFNKK